MGTREAAMPAFSFDASSGTVALPVSGPLRFAETLTYLTRSPLECLHRVEDGKVYKLLNHDGAPLLTEICADKEDSGLLIRLHGGLSTDAGAAETAVRYTADWFDLARDLRPFYRMAENDPILGPLTESYYGLRLIGVPNLFEALCWAIVGQQINLTFAYTLKRRIVQTYGRRETMRGDDYWLFPEPKDLAAASIQDLRALQLTGKKAEYVLAVAGLMDSGELSKEALLADGSFADAERRLLAIRGIGPWTAHYVGMRCLRNPAAFPIADVGLHNALKLILRRDIKPPLDEIRSIFAPWAGWEAYAVFYLWRSIAAAS